MKPTDQQKAVKSLILPNKPHYKDVDFHLIGRLLGVEVIFDEKHQVPILETKFV